MSKQKPNVYTPTGNGTDINLDLVLKNTGYVASNNNNNNNNVNIGINSQNTTIDEEDEQQIGGTFVRTMGTLEPSDQPEIIAHLERAHFPSNLKHSSWMRWIGILFVELIAVLLFVVITGELRIKSGGDKFMEAFITGITVTGLLVLFQDISGVHLSFMTSFIETIGQMGGEHAWDYKLALGFVIYFAAQTGGAISGAAILMGFEGVGSGLGQPVIGFGQTQTSAFFAEWVGSTFLGLSYFLMTAYYRNAPTPPGKIMSQGRYGRPLAIGFTYAAVYAAFWHISGASFTWVRWWGAAMLTGSWADWWVYLAGPAAGYVTAIIISWVLAHWVFHYARTLSNVKKAFKTA